MFKVLETPEDLADRITARFLAFISRVLAHPAVTVKDQIDLGQKLLRLETNAIDVLFEKPTHQLEGARPATIAAGEGELALAVEKYSALGEDLLTSIMKHHCFTVELEAKGAGFVLDDFARAFWYHVRIDHLAKFRGKLSPHHSGQGSARSPCGVRVFAECSKSHLCCCFLALLENLHALTTVEGVVMFRSSKLLPGFHHFGPQSATVSPFIVK
jgi:hypothetical protein